MKTALAALLATLLLYPFPALADDGPARGMSKVQVRQHYGEPESRREPVGQPPISRWYYPDFTVYFENDTVLHSVREAAADDGQPGTTEAERQAGHPLPAEVEDEEAQIETRSTVRNEEADSDDSSSRDDDDGEDTDESHTAPGSTAVRARAGDDEGREERREPAGEVQEDADQKDGRFRFDPVSGRIVIDEDENQDNNDRGADRDDEEPRAEAPRASRPLRADAD